MADSKVRSVGMMMMIRIKIRKATSIRRVMFTVTGSSVLMVTSPFMLNSKNTSLNPAICFSVNWSVGGGRLITFCFNLN